MFFDAHLEGSLAAADSLPNGLSGAILYNTSDLPVAPGHWLLAAAQDQIAEVSRNPAVKIVDVRIPPSELLARLKRPKPEWFLLAEGVRVQKQFLRLSLPPGASCVVGTKKLAEHFPQTRFLLNPFLHGPGDGWQAQVRLAETENIWLTTLGLSPGPRCRWPRTEDVDEALHFAMGEVGASRLVYASGLSASMYEFFLFDPQKWLADIKVLDEDQRALILDLNARELFG